MFRRLYPCCPIAKSLISQSLIAKFGIRLPASPGAPFAPLDWQDDASSLQTSWPRVDYAFSTSDQPLSARFIIIAMSGRVISQAPNS
jgi:hypothetical protein